MKTSDYDHSQFFTPIDVRSSDPFDWRQAKFEDTAEGIEIYDGGVNVGQIYVEFDITSETTGILQATFSHCRWPGEEATVDFSLVTGFDHIDWCTTPTPSFQEFVERMKAEIVRTALVGGLFEPIRKVLASASREVA